MSHNMGSADRIVRAAIVAPALVIIALVVGASSAAGIVLFVLAAVMLATSAVGTCPLYAPLGITTCKRPGSTA